VASGFKRSTFMTISMTILKPLSRSPQKGAETLVWLVDSPDVANETGGYFADRRRVAPSAEAQDGETARRLWEVSEAQTRVPATADR
jgi:hypothetical protein